MPRDFKDSFFRSNYVLIGLVVVTTAILLFLSCWFYLERMICADAPIYLWEIIDKEGFHVATNRLISVLGQGFPVAVIWMGASLKWVLVLYSFNLMFFHAVILLLILFWLNDLKLALSLLLGHLLLANYLFYYPISEFQMGISVLFLLLSFYRTKYNKKPVHWSCYVFSAFCIFAIVFSHPLIPALYVFAFLFLAIQQSKWKDASWWMHVIVFIVGWLLKWLLWPIPYDQNRVEKVNYIKEVLSDFFHSTPVVEFWHQTTSYNYLLLGLFVLLICFYLIKKKYLQLGLVFSFAVGYWLLIVASIGEWHYSYHIEHLYQPLAYMVSLAFVCDVLFVFPTWFRNGLVVVLLVIRINVLFHFNHYSGNRIQWIERTGQKMMDQGIYKGVVLNYHLPTKSQPHGWALYAESLLVSSLSLQEPVTIMAEYTETPEYLNGETHMFVLGWKKEAIFSPTFPRKYFPLREGAYHFLPLDAQGEYNPQKDTTNVE